MNTTKFNISFEFNHDNDSIHFDITGDPTLLDVVSMVNILLNAGEQQLPGFKQQTLKILSEEGK